MTGNTPRQDIERIYKLWDEALGKRDLEASLALYAEDASIESPLVQHLLGRRDGTVQGKYFNRIIGDLKKFNRGRMLGQVASWMETLHGYLSAPGGGGVRHGTVLNDAYELSDVEARLICDLARSYISYLLNEHHRLGLR